MWAVRVAADPGIPMVDSACSRTQRNVHTRYPPPPSAIRPMTQRIAQCASAHRPLKAELCLVSHVCRSWLRRGSAAIACTSCRTSCRAPRPRHPGGRWTARQVLLIKITVGGTRRCLLSGWTGAGLRVPMERTAAPVVSADRPRVRRHDCTAGKSELRTVVVGHVPSLTAKSALLLVFIAFRRHYCTAAVWPLPRGLLPPPLCRGASWASRGLVVYP